MVQEFQVLRCFSCQTFQVHQIKKSKKWNCKLCGEKQSLLKVYGQGSGADCRQHVQKLNLLQGEALQAIDPGFGLNDDEEEISENVPDEQRQAGTVEFQNRGEFVSRWNKYVDENPEHEYVALHDEETTTNPTDTDTFFSQQWELPLKRRMQEDAPLEEYEIQGSQQLKRSRSTDSNSEAKRFKIRENRKMVISAERLHCPSINTEIVLSHGHENKQMSFQPASSLSRYTESKCDKYISTMNNEERKEECSSMPSNRQENKTFMVVSLRKEECNTKEEGKAEEAQAICSRTAQRVPVCSTGSSSTSELFIQIENPSRGNVYICPEDNQKGQVMGNPNLSVNGGTVPSNVSSSVAHTNFFQTDEDFDDCY